MRFFYPSMSLSRLALIFEAEEEACIGIARRSLLDKQRSILVDMAVFTEYLVHVNIIDATRRFVLLTCTLCAVVIALWTVLIVVLRTEDDHVGFVLFEIGVELRGDCIGGQRLRFDEKIDVEKRSSYEIQGQRIGRSGRQRCEADGNGRERNRRADEWIDREALHIGRLE